MPVNARKAAVEAACEILDYNLKPKDVLSVRYAGLKDADRVFLMELLYGMIRQKDLLDWILGRHLRKPGGLSRLTMENLRAGAYQIFFMRVPEWAAVDEAVRIEKSLGKEGRPPLVNAVLRSVVREADERRLEMDAMRRTALNDDTDASKAATLVSTLTSHPIWLVKRWLKRFGREGALALADANNRPGPLTLRVNTLKANRESILGGLAEMSVGGIPTRHSPQGITITSGRAHSLLEALPDSLTVQDEAAQLVSLMLAPQPGERVLDACAAPGGKATHIAELMGDKGEVVAMDIDPRRLKKVTENSERLGLRCIKPLVADAIHPPSDIGTFDRIILDAPCSALGVVRRNPDVKFRRSAGDLQRFGDKQLGMLNALSLLLKPGGVIVFATCSTEPEEGEDVVRRFLKSSGDLYNIGSDVPYIMKFMEEGYMRTFPHIHDLDGFFAARLCRRA